MRGSGSTGGGSLRLWSGSSRLAYATTNDVPSVGWNFVEIKNINFQTSTDDVFANGSLVAHRAFDSTGATTANTIDCYGIFFGTPLSVNFDEIVVR